MEKNKRRIMVAVIAAVVLAALVFAFAGCSSSTSILQVTENGTYSTDGYDSVSVEVPSASYDVTISESESDYSGETLVDTIARVRPTVVDVDAVLSYNLGTGEATAGTSAGSGVIIGGETAGVVGTDSNTAYDRYYIVTNHHVINDSGYYHASYSVDVLTIDDDGNESTTVYEAKLIGSSPSRDIAVLVIDPPDGTQLSVATFVADSDTVRVGTEVFAIGNPLGILGGTVTKGIVSATKREVTVDEIGTMTLMQTDTAINSGNSGGGLFDTNGNLVGIINSGYDSYNNQSVEGLNFAIPGNDAKYAAQQLIENHDEDNEGNVTDYGFVTGDVLLDVSYNTYLVYESSRPSQDNYNYYVGACATSSSSPLAGDWGVNYIKALISITVDGTETDLSPNSDESTYALYEKATAAFDSIEVGSSVTIQYRDIYEIFNRRYFNDSEIKTLDFEATQYTYIPVSAA